MALSAFTLAVIFSILQEKPLYSFTTKSNFAGSVQQINLERFPGEQELLKAINSPGGRYWITVVKNNGEVSGWNPVPEAYGEQDLLQILQEKGIDTYPITDSADAREIGELLQNLEEDR